MFNDIEIVELIKKQNYAYSEINSNDIRIHNSSFNFFFLQLPLLQKYIYSVCIVIAGGHLMTRYTSSKCRPSTRTRTCITFSSNYSIWLWFVKLPASLKLNFQLNLYDGKATYYYYMVHQTIINTYMLILCPQAVTIKHQFNLVKCAHTMKPPAAHQNVSIFAH